MSYIQTAVVFPVYTVATLPAAGTAGRIARVSNVGTKPTWFEDNGTRWHVLNGRATVATVDAPVPIAGAGGEGVVIQTLLPAGAWQVGDRVRAYLNITKAGASTAGAVSARVGTAGTTSDALIITGTVLTAAGRDINIIMDIVLVSDTTAQAQSPTASGTIGYGNTQTTGALGAAVTISSAAANPLYITFTLTPGATDAVGLNAGVLELLSSAN